MADSVEFLRVLIFFVALFCLSLATLPQDQQRKITTKSIPCPTNITGCKNTTYIIHVIAESTDKQNSMHYLWSVIGSPTIIAAYFDTIDVNVSIDWNQVLINSSTKGIKFTQPSLYITALVIPAIYEFQDKKDELYYTEKDIGKIVKHGFQDKVTHWEEPEVDPKNNVTTFRGKMLGGTVIFQCNASAINDRESILPHQQFSSNSTVFTLTLDRLTNLYYKKYVRFIFELVSFSADDSYTCVTAQKSLDDEHTPAVFKTIVINSTLSGRSSYSAWKPVAYLKESRKLSNQVPSYSYFGNQHQFISQQCESLPSSSSSPKDFISIVSHLNEKNFITNQMNISFGQRKDGWYEGSKYLTWSAMVGYGTPIKDEFSTLVWLIIFIGFGTPMLLIFITIIYIIIKKVKAKKATSAYGIIN